MQHCFSSVGLLQRRLLFPQPVTSSRAIRCNGLKENVAALPAITGIRRVLVPAADHSIENVEGKKASVAIYSHLAQQFDGKLTAAAAARGLQIYEEVVEDAKQHPGSHPNIDLLLRVASENLTMDIVVERDG